jgi:hypothetical protein
MILYYRVQLYFVFESIRRECQRAPRCIENAYSEKMAKRIKLVGMLLQTKAN